MEKLLEDGGASWRDFLDRWTREVYIPAFKPYGISKDTALMVWFQNKTFNLLSEDIEADETEEERNDEPWRN